MRDKDMEEVIRAANTASEAVMVLREKVWTLMQKDPSYSLIVLNGLKSVGLEFFGASCALNKGSDMLADLNYMDRAGVA